MLRQVYKSGETAAEGHRNRDFSTKSDAQVSQTVTFLMKMEDLGPKSDTQVSQTEISARFLIKTLQTQIRSAGVVNDYFFHKHVLFWTHIRCTGAANGDFRPTSDAQVSQTVIVACVFTILDQNPMHRYRKCRFWSKIRCTGVANGDFSIFVILTRP